MFDDVIKLYRNNPSVLSEHPFRVQFEDECAIDAGGVARDMFSGFWCAAAMQILDGGSLLIPAVHPHIDKRIFPTLGTILSHGYLSSGFLPISIAFPPLALALLGPLTPIPTSILIESFGDYLSSYERDVLNDAFKIANCAKVFPYETSRNLVNLLSRLGCRELPTPQNLSRLIAEVAEHEFAVKPGSALYAMHSGIPTDHRSFWERQTVEKLYQLYKALSASPSKVIEMIQEPEEMSSAQLRVFGYLIQFLGSLNIDDLRKFLRYVTGASVCSATLISVTFTGASGLGRAVGAHTYSNTLSQPTSYATFPEFATEFQLILSDPLESWLMNVL